MSANTYIVEEAVHSDFEKCMNINRNIYLGSDYLSGMYHEFLHNSNFKILVVKQAKTKEIVSIFQDFKVQ